MVLLWKARTMVSKLAIAMISPLGAALGVGALACFLGMFRRSRVALVLGFSALVWLYAWSLPVMSLWLRARIEGQYPATTIQAVRAAQAIVVLGGAIAPAQAGHNEPNLGAGVDRVWYAARLYHAGKAPLLLLSGGSDPTISMTSEAEAMRLLLRDLGVPDTAMLLESRSRTTEENARFSGALLRQRGITTVLLVTSALHMKRAFRHWDAEGLQVQPAATDYEARLVPVWQMWLPDAGALDGSARALKELVGSWLQQIASTRAVLSAQTVAAPIPWRPYDQATVAPQTAARR
jgi:uncharacterized SAM-binding protein YcdF (DUF218 family)